MNAWIVTVGEPLPTDGPDVRLYRSGILAATLAERGHEVTWWSSSFDHIARKQRQIRRAKIAAKGDLRLELVPTPGYDKSVGFRRLWSHAVCAGRFARAAGKKTVPDVVLVSFPTIELTLAAANYGRRKGIPVVADIRDLWPDLFVEAFPEGLQAASRALLLPYEYMAASGLARVSRITGITDHFIEWAFSKAGRPKPDRPTSFSMGYEAVDIDEIDLQEANSFWQDQGVGEDDWLVCFFGTLGRQFELDSVINAAAIIESRRLPVRFVICGDGDNATRYRDLASERTNMLFPGWITRSKIQALMKMSKIGLAPYRPTPNFLLNLPNKPIEYLSQGLPILSTIDGVLGKLIRDNEAGIVVADQEPESIANAIEELYFDGAKLSEMRQASRQVFESRFRADVVYAEFADYLEQVASEGVRAQKSESEGRGLR